MFTKTPTRRHGKPKSEHSPNKRKVSHSPTVEFIKLSKITPPTRQRPQDDCPVITVMKKPGQDHAYDVITGSKLLADMKREKKLSTPIEVHVLHESEQPIERITPHPVLANVILTEDLIESYRKRYVRQGGWLPVIAIEGDGAFQIIHGIQAYRTAQALGQKTLPVIVFPRETVDNTSIDAYWHDLALTEKIHSLGETLCLHNDQVNANFQALKKAHLAQDPPAILKDAAQWQAAIFSSLQESVVALLKLTCHELDQPIVDVIQSRLKGALAKTLQRYATEFADETFEVARLKQHPSYREIRRVLSETLTNFLQNNDIESLFQKPVNTQEKPHYLFEKDDKLVDAPEWRALENFAVSYYTEMVSKKQAGHSQNPYITKTKTIKSVIRVIDNPDIPEALKTALKKNPGKSLKEVLDETGLKTTLSKSLFEAMRKQIDITLHQSKTDSRLAKTVFRTYAINQTKLSGPMRSTLLKMLEKLINKGLERKYEDNKSLHTFLTELKKTVSSEDFIANLEFKLTTGLLLLRDQNHFKVKRLKNAQFLFPPADSLSMVLAQLRFTEFACKRHIKSLLADLLEKDKQEGDSNYPFLHPMPRYSALMEAQGARERVALLPDKTPFPELKFIFQLASGQLISVSVFISKYGLLTFKVDQFQNYCASDKRGRKAGKQDEADAVGDEDGKTDGAYYKLQDEMLEQNDDALCEFFRSQLDVTQDPLTTELSDDVASYLKLFIFCLFYIEGMRNPASFVTHACVLQQLLEASHPTKFIDALDSGQFAMTSEGATAEGRKLHQMTQRVTRGQTPLGETLYGLFNAGSFKEKEIRSVQAVSASPTKVVTDMYKI